MTKLPSQKTSSCSAMQLFQQASVVTMVAGGSQQNQHNICSVTFNTVWFSMKKQTDLLVVWLLFPSPVTPVYPLWIYSHFILHYKEKNINIKNGWGFTPHRLKIKCKKNAATKLRGHFKKILGEYIVSLRHEITQHRDTTQNQHV